MSKSSLQATNTSVQQILAIVTKKLSSFCPIRNAQQEACWLVSHVLGISSTALITYGKTNVDKAAYEKIMSLIQERIIKQKPLQYILGTIPFLELTLHVQSPTLIPRHETEEMCSWTIQQYPASRPHAILDLCTGSGCIALALAHAFPLAQVIGSDVNATALKLAEKNKKELQITNVHFMKGDLFSAIPDIRFNLIIANPPYLSEDEWCVLPPSIKNWEDKAALVSSEQGLLCYQHIITQAPCYLKQSNNNKNMIPRLVLEINPILQKKIYNLLCVNHYKNIMFFKDIFQNVRWVSAHY